MAEDTRVLYESLARMLEGVPPGLPRTADGQLEIDLLRWIFEPEEAEVALGVLPMPEPAAAIAARLNRPLAEVLPILDGMVEKSTLMPLIVEGLRLYRVVPIIVGLQEVQLWRRDRSEAEKREFTVLWEDYIATWAETGSYGPATFRILPRSLPVNMAIEANSTSPSTEDAHRLIDEADSVGVAPCVCREERRVFDGSNCNHTSQVCLFLMKSDVVDIYKWYNVLKPIAKEEAHVLIDKCADEGLIHETFNFKDTPLNFICNCCSCCCVVLRAVKHVAGVVTSDFVAHIDEAECTSCGACKAEGCTMDAIVEADGSYGVVVEKCVGCGLCVVKCPSGGITLVRRTDAAPPLSMMDWFVARETNRASQG